MIMLCQEIKEVKVEDKKMFVYRLILEGSMPQNSSYRAAVLEFVTQHRLHDIEPGDHYTIKRIPFTSPVQIVKNTKNGKLKNRVAAQLQEQESEG